MSSFCRVSVDGIQRAKKLAQVPCLNGDQANMHLKAANLRSNADGISRGTRKVDKSQIHQEFIISARKLLIHLSTLTFSLSIRPSASMTSNICLVMFCGKQTTVFTKFLTSRCTNLFNCMKRSQAENNTYPQSMQTRA